MAPPKKHNFTPHQAKQAYLQLGVHRSLKKLHDFFLETHQSSPGLDNLKRWSAKGGWAQAAFEHDGLAGKAMLAAGQHRRRVNFHARERLLQTAEKFLNRVDEWAESKEKAVRSVHIKSATDAGVLLNKAIDAIMKAEVLEGRVSDRQAEEKSVTVEDKREEAANRAIENMKRLERHYAAQGVLPAPADAPTVIEAEYEPAGIS